MSTELNNLCMSCMKDKAGDEVCPHCGYSEKVGQMESALPFRHVLQGRYLVGRAIDFNGEGIGYIGYDTLSKSPIYIREYMPNNFCFRDANKVNIVAAKGSELSFTENARNFLEYNRRLASMRSLSSLIPIFDIFSQNGTDYIITEYVEYITLKEYISKSGGRVDWECARHLFMPVLTTLIELKRAGINHLGISPENLIILQNGKMKLKGFCIPEIRKKDSDLKPEIFEGCAAIEQYTLGAEVGEAADIYAFAANVFFSLTGKLPLNAIKRRNDGKLFVKTDILRTIPNYVTTTLADALRVDPKYRISSLERLRDELNASPTMSISLTSIRNRGKELELEQKAEKNTKRYKQIAAIFLTLILTAVIVLVFLLSYQLKVSKNRDRTSNVLNNREFSLAKDLSKSKQYENSSNGVSKEIVIQDFSRKNYEKTKQDVQILRDEIKLVKVSEVFNEEVNQGDIISQEPKPGTKVISGSTVSVVVSKGAEMRKLPDLEGETIEEAIRALKLRGVEPKIGKEESEPNIAAGKVIGYENYEVGSRVRYGSTVKLKISKG